LTSATIPQPTEQAEQTDLTSFEPECASLRLDAVFVTAVLAKAPVDPKAVAAAAIFRKERLPTFAGRTSFLVSISPCFLS
jgi:hypothetical protein